LGTGFFCNAVYHSVGRVASTAADSHPATPQRLHLFLIFLLITDLMIAIVIFLGIIGALGSLGPLLFG